MQVPWQLLPAADSQIETEVARDQLTLDQQNSDLKKIRDATVVINPLEEVESGEVRSFLERHWKHIDKFISGVASRGAMRLIADAGVCIGRRCK